MSEYLPRLLITPGEPAGIGSELLVRLAQNDQPGELVAVCDPELLQATAADLGLALQLRPAQPGTPPQRHVRGQLAVLATTLAAPVTPGRLDPRNAAYVLQCLTLAADTCLRGQADALVTGPVQKSLINNAGIAFSGHTEFLAQHCGDAMPVMMLVAGDLRVALATTHLPLRQVPGAITPARLRSVLQILNADLGSRFGLARPRILVCGLNPHAGEGGHLGREEIEVIAPVIAELRAQGLQLEGPLPADTLFTPRVLARGDAVLAMYHDQGLPVLKYAGFGQAVNITLGLPLLRTSVDHGTALELVGSGQADPGSLQAAITLAAQLARPAGHRA